MRGSGESSSTKAVPFWRCQNVKWPVSSVHMTQWTCVFPGKVSWPRLHWKRQIRHPSAPHALCPLEIIYPASVASSNVGIHHGQINTNKMSQVRATVIFLSSPNWIKSRKISFSALKLEGPRCRNKTRTNRMNSLQIASSLLIAFPSNSTFAMVCGGNSYWSTTILTRRGAAETAEISSGRCQLIWPHSKRENN